MDALQYPFDGAHILQKKRAIKKQLLTKEGLIDKKIALVSGSTIGDIKTVLEIFLLNLGIRPTFWEGEYGLFYENVCFDDGSLKEFAPDILYIHTSNRNIRHWPHCADKDEDVQQKLQGEFAHFKAVWAAAKRLGCAVVQNNFEMPSFRHFGNMDAWDARGRVRYVRCLNEMFAQYAQESSGLYIHDLSYLSACHGTDAWCDASSWYAYKYTLAPAFIPSFCHSLAGLMSCLFGRTKKAAVCDLDNTLWGGVIGEVSAEGVELGDESPAGMAYADFQRYLHMLSQRGILLSVASKNEPAAALSGFERSDSPLKRSDFLCFEASWEPKSRSVAHIAKTLNIGTDSLVFLDDNPAERQEVTRAMPEVCAPCVCQPEESVCLVDRAGYFEIAALSADDVKRGDMYRQNAQRNAEIQNFEDYDAYLKSLEMSAHISPFSAEHLERITQLINKTNQFNLTTRRYTAEEVAARVQDKSYITLSGRLVDKFGDNGITTSIIGHINGGVLDIELWVMSCRVFKRHLEHAMFDALVAAAQQASVHTITGCYLPTAKNLLVSDFYATMGFKLTGEEEGTRRFSYDVPSSYTQKNTVIKVD